MKISISGIVGSGKTTISKMISERYGCDCFSVGSIMREMAVERSLTIQEFTEDAKKDSKIDFELDRRQRELNEGSGNFVMDSRLGFYFIPDSFKIFLKIDLSEAARRIFEEKRYGERYENIKECLEFLEKRVASEKIRYKQYYDVDFLNEGNFDLVLDSTNKSPEEIVEEILEFIPNEGCNENEG